MNIYIKYFYYLLVYLIQSCYCKNAKLTKFLNWYKIVFFHIKSYIGEKNNIKIFIVTIFPTYDGKFFKKWKGAIISDLPPQFSKFIFVLFKLPNYWLMFYPFSSLYRYYFNISSLIFILKKLVFFNFIVWITTTIIKNNDG